jgi:hypothetical protein
VVNPTDIVVPYSFDQLDTEERRGVDAVRVRIPTGIMGEVDMGAISGEDFDPEKSAVFLRSRFYELNTDISLMLLGFQGNLMMGLDVARNIGGAGFWLECAYVSVSVYESESHDPGDGYFRGTVGMDYSFVDGMYTFLEYHWNQAGSRNPEEYLDSLSSVAYADGATYLMGEHYLVPGTTYQLTPLTSLSSQLLLNVFDPSVFVSTTLDYNIAQSIYLSAGAMVGIGKSPDDSVVSGSPDQALRSEFGGYPNVYYSSFRVYF